MHYEIRRWRRGCRTALVGCSLLGGLSACAGGRVTVPLMPPFLPAALPSVVWAEPFDSLDPQRWREIVVRGHTQYEVVELDGARCLRARSEQTASILLSAVRFDPDTYEWFSWRWRVDELVDGEALERKDGSDAAARVYVYFDTAGLPWQKRSLDYVWSASLPVGTVMNSAFSAESKIIVVESGPAALGQWRTVERNLEADYERGFGQSLPDAVAIGLMTDTDNTGKSATAYFDDLVVSRSPVTPGRGNR